MVSLPTTRAVVTFFGKNKSYIFAAEIIIRHTNVIWDRRPTAVSRFTAGCIALSSSLEFGKAEGTDGDTRVSPSPAKACSSSCGTISSPFTRTYDGTVKFGHFS